jgi:hypothetical protein
LPVEDSLAGGIMGHAKKAQWLSPQAFLEMETASPDNLFYSGS